MHELAECLHCGDRIYKNKIISRWLHTATGESTCRIMATPAEGTVQAGDLTEALLGDGRA